MNSNSRSDSTRVNIRMGSFLRGSISFSNPVTSGRAIPAVFVHRRHRSRRYTSTKTITHNQIVTLTKFVDERCERRKVVALIRIAHDDISSFRGFDPRRESGAVATDRNVHHPYVQPQSDLN